MQTELTVRGWETLLMWFAATCKSCMWSHIGTGTLGASQMVRYLVVLLGMAAKHTTRY